MLNIIRKFNSNLLFAQTKNLVFSDKRILSFSSDINSFNFVVNKFNDIHIKSKDIIAFHHQNKSPEVFESSLKSLL